MKELIINKSNSMTEAKTAELRLFDDKMINIIYYLIENSDNEDNNLRINLLNVKKLLNIKSNDYIELIISSLERLDNKKISMRNINYKGRNIEWIRSSIIKEMILFTDSRSNLEIEVSRALIEGLKQKSNFTPIDISICNRFKSKYGLKIYELYKRYENYEKIKQHTSIDSSYNSFSISTIEASERFKNNFKYVSKWKEAFKRGLNEIKQITNVEIEMIFDKREKMFIFYWKNNNNNLEKFIKEIRKKYINRDIFDFIQKDGKKVCLSVNQDGKLYNKYERSTINSKQAEELWKWLFENQKIWRKKC